MPILLCCEVRGSQGQIVVTEAVRRCKPTTEYPTQEMQLVAWLDSQWTEAADVTREGPREGAATDICQKGSRLYVSPGPEVHCFHRRTLPNHN